MKFLASIFLLITSFAAFSQAMDNFSPTVVSQDTLQDLKKVMKSGYKPKGQCYNRAHYWSYQLDTSRKVKAMKIFIFFRKEFMNIDKFDWWFHVAPAVMVEGDSEPQMLDLFLWNGPVSLSYWQTHFLRMGGSDRSSCKLITKYSDYVKNTYNEHCYIMYTAPQYISPKELQKLENQGIHKPEGWISREVRRARKQAFWF